MAIKLESLPPALQAQAIAALTAAHKPKEAPPRPVPQAAARKPAVRAVLAGLPGCNNLERAYAAELDRRMREGEILAWAYEPERLKIAPSCYYVPDFRLILPSGEIEFHETKGFWQDDARVKIKAAAALHPYRFIGVRKRPKKAGGGWDFEHFPAQ